MLFFLNGVTPFEIILKYAKKEFGNNIGNPKTYFELKNNLINELKNLQFKDFEENKLDTLLGIEHLKLNDFANFMSLRFTYWGIIITSAVVIIGNSSIHTYFNITMSEFARMVIFILIIILGSMSTMIHYQHSQLEYLNFKLICFDEIKASKRKV